MRANVLNQLLDNKLFDADESQRPQTSYICTSFSLIFSSNLCLADYPCSAKNLYLPDNLYLANNLCFTQLNQTHFSSLLSFAKAKLSSLKFWYENNAFYIFLYILANFSLAIKGSRQKKFPNPKLKQLVWVMLCLKIKKKRLKCIEKNSCV